MVIIIAAIARNNCIGKDGNLPWSLPEDLKHFKQLTTGHPVIMGRKTWESIPDQFRPLPGRLNIVVTRQPTYEVPDDVELANSVDEALRMHASEEVFVIGGAEIYAQAMSKADRLEITHVEQTIDGDVFFPNIDPALWKESSRESHDGFAFVRYDRIH